MSPIKRINSRIVDEAHRLVSICKHLDFPAIVRHESLAVAQLQQAIQTLGIRVHREMKPNSPQLPSVAKATETKPVLAGAGEGRSDSEQAIARALQQAGFADRLGKIYNSESKQRTVHFADVSQRSGLPSFLFVICPDFAPVAGYHGIFITATEVFAAVFPINGNGQWQIDARRNYANLSQMEEWVTLLSAGFALP